MHFFNDPSCVDHTDEYLQLLPKRMGGQLPPLPPRIEPKGWGLVAVHGPSFFLGFLAVTLITLVVFVIGGMVAWYWMKTHPADLGGGLSPLGVGATVLALSLAALAMVNSKKITYD